MHNLNRGLFLLLKTIYFIYFFIIRLTFGWNCSYDVNGQILQLIYLINYTLRFKQVCWHKADSLLLTLCREKADLQIHYCVFKRQLAAKLSLMKSFLSSIKHKRRYQAALFHKVNGEYSCPAIYNMNKDIILVCCTLVMKSQY